MKLISILLWLSVAALFVYLPLLVLKLKDGAERRRYQRIFDEMYPIGFETVFSGELHWHWEASSFFIYKEGHLLGGPTKGVGCELKYSSPDQSSDWLREELSSDGDYVRLAVFDLTFRGKVIVKGRCGYRGLLDYTIAVNEVLSHRVIEIRRGLPTR